MHLLTHELHERVPFLLLVFLFHFVLAHHQRFHVQAFLQDDVGCTDNQEECSHLKHETEHQMAR